MKWSVQTAFFLLFAASVAMGNECFVSGITVDASGRPVEGATVIAYSPPSGWEDLIVSYESIEDGAFYVPYDCRSTKTTLFVVAPHDTENDFVPLRPPYSISSKVTPLLAGKRLPSIRNGTYRIGRVVVTELFPVTVKLINAGGGDFLPKEHSHDFWLRIGLGSKNWLRSGSLSQRDWRRATQGGNSTFRMLLPEGKWTINTSLTSGKPPYFYADKQLEVTRTDRPLEIVLKMSKE